MRYSAYVVWLMTFATILWSLSVAADQGVCRYLDQKGRLREVRSLNQVPSAHRAKAVCGVLVQPRDVALAAPAEIQLEGTVRRDTISTPLGRIEARWARSSESFFGRTPARAIADAAQAAQKALLKGGFSERVRNLSLPWQIVIMDENVPETQIPSYLVSNCHPAWMTPPANIYVVAQRVVEGCGMRKGLTSREADSELAPILIHEIGHVIEFVLLEGRGGNERMRAEGFASWFEQYASDFSTVVSRGTTKARYAQLATASFRQSPDIFTFQGSAEDYARASLFFHAVVRTRGIGSLMKVYDRIRQENVGLVPAILAEMGWSEKKLHEELLESVS